MFSPVFEPEQPFTYSEYLDGVAQASLRHEKMIVFQPVRKNQVLGGSLRNLLSIDGRLLLGLVDDGMAEIFSVGNTPLVVLGEHQCQRPVWNVNLDFQAGGEMAVSHLWNLGHRRIALHCEEEQRGYQTEFERGFENALRIRGVNLHEAEILGYPTDPDGRLGRLLQSEDRPTAIIAIQTGRAMRTLEVAAEQGLRVPEQLSLMVMGRPGGNVAHLTHLDPCYEEVGRQGMELLLRLARQEYPDKPCRMLVPPNLVPGSSCIFRSA